jgi:hypothetical protein
MVVIHLYSSEGAVLVQFMLQSTWLAAVHGDFFYMCLCQVTDKYIPFSTRKPPNATKKGKRIPIQP